MTSRRRLVLGLAAFQLFDAGFNAVGLYGYFRSTWWGARIEKWTKDDLDHLRVPESVRVAFPIIKSSSAAGLVLGLRWPRLGRLTAAALVAYFVAALAFHRRVHDTLVRQSPAAVMLVWSATVLHLLRVPRAEP